MSLHHRYRHLQTSQRDFQHAPLPTLPRLPPLGLKRSRHCRSFAWWRDETVTAAALLQRNTLTVGWCTNVGSR